MRITYDPYCFAGGPLFFPGRPLIFDVSRCWTVKFCWFELEAEPTGLPLGGGPRRPRNSGASFWALGPTGTTGVVICANSAPELLRGGGAAQATYS